MTVHKELKEEFAMGKAIGKAEAEEKAAEGKEIALVPKELAAYADNLPYSLDRISEEVKFFLKHEISAKFEVGKRLILIREMEGIRRGGDHTSAEAKAKRARAHFDFEGLIQERFGLPKRRAYEYMLFAQKATVKFKEWGEGGKNWKKAIALLSFCDAAEIKAIESGEPVSGMTLDDIDAMTFTEVRDNLRRARAREERGKEQLTTRDKLIEQLKRGYIPSAEEEDFQKKMDALIVGFMGYYIKIDPEQMTELMAYDDADADIRELEDKGTAEARAQAKELEKKLPPKPTKAMLAAYFTALRYMKQMICSANIGAEERYGTADMFPENVYRPGMDAAEETFEEARNRMVERSDKIRAGKKAKE